MASDQWILTTTHDITSGEHSDDHAWKVIASNG